MTTLLVREYGLPRHGNPTDPLDDLIYVLISQMTTGPSYARVYARLKDTRGGWERVRRMREPTLRAKIKDAGLSQQKAPRILAILDRLSRDFGRTTLRPLRRMSDAEALAYLQSLPGVGPKTARCVLMYTLGRAALPVDTHLDRIAVRLGLVRADLPRLRRHEELEALVAPPDRYGLHVAALAHGRAVCRAVAPRCGGCVVRSECGLASGPLDN